MERRDTVIDALVEMMLENEIATGTISAFMRERAGIPDDAKSAYDKFEQKMLRCAGAFFAGVVIGIKCMEIADDVENAVGTDASKAIMMYIEPGLVATCQESFSKKRHGTSLEFVESVIAAHEDEMENPGSQKRDMERQLISILMDGLRDGESSGRGDSAPEDFIGGLDDMLKGGKR